MAADSSLWATGLPRADATTKSPVRGPQFPQLSKGAVGLAWLFAFKFSQHFEQLKSLSGQEIFHPG